MNKLEIDDILFTKTTDSFDAEDKKQLLDQYKLFVEMADKVSERRQQANNFYLTVNTLILTTLSAFIGLIQEFGTNRIWIVIPSLAGLVFCVSWQRLIKSYGQLNQAKFTVVNSIEKLLIVKPYFTEWELLDRGEKSSYSPFTRTEIYVPWIFGVFYIIIMLLGLLGY